MVIIGATGGGMERRNAIEIEDEIFSVTHWGGVMLITGQSHWKKREKKIFSVQVTQMTVRCITFIISI